MEVEFRTTIDDYVAFYQYFYFRRRLGLRILFVIWASWVADTLIRGNRPAFTWTSLLIFVLMVPIFIGLFFVLPYIRTMRATRKMLAAPGQLDQKRLILTADGFTGRKEGEAGAGTADSFWRWESVRVVDSTDRFVFIQLRNWKVVLIPRQYFHAENEVDNFIGIVRNGMAKVRGTSLESDQAKARRVAYWGLIGFIPNFGVIAGLVLLYQGIIRLRSRLLIIIGLADILFTFVFWAAMQHWVFNGPTFTQMNKQLSKSQLNTVFKSVEFYKLQHGHYPDSLQQVEDIKGYVWISDPLSHKGFGSKAVNFYYQKTGDKYWLFSVGEDGQPFTADDIYPTMIPGDSTKFGLRLP